MAPAVRPTAKGSTLRLVVGCLFVNLPRDPSVGGEQGRIALGLTAQLLCEASSLALFQSGNVVVSRMPKLVSRLSDFARLK